MRVRNVRNRSWNRKTTPGCTAERGGDQLMRVESFRIHFFPLWMSWLRGQRIMQESLASSEWINKVENTPWQNPVRRKIPAIVSWITAVARVPGLSHYQFGIPLLSPGYRKANRRDKVWHCPCPQSFFAGREAACIARHQGIPLVGTFHTKYYDDLVQADHSKLRAAWIFKITSLDFMSDAMKSGRSVREQQGLKIMGTRA